MSKIGFIGTGVMGRSMVRNLMKKGFSLYVYNRTKESAQELIKEGAIWCESVKECAQDKDFVITIVGYPKDVEQVYFGLDGIVENAKEGSVLIDMTTTSPKLAQKIYAQAKSRGINALDAPVSGGDLGAKNATLAIMVGGEEAVFNKCISVFEAMGTNIKLVGAAGCGQHVKMANQIAIAGTLSGVTEAISYAKKMGVDTEIMLSTISSGAAGSWQMSNNGPKANAKDYAPGFFIKHFVKDMKIAIEEAQEKGIDLSVLKDTCQKFEQLEKDGMGDLGTQALIEYYK